MISIQEIKNILNQNGIHYIDQPVDYLQFIASTDAGNRVKFFFDTEGKFLELSAYSYSFTIDLNGSNLLLINDVNNIVDTQVKMLKFSILGNGHLRIEFDVPHANISDPTIILKFISLAAAGMDYVYKNMSNR